MAIEIERKFLLAHSGWRDEVHEVQSLRQAYLGRLHQLAARVRMVGEDRALLTLKTAQRSLTREEYEYEIPYADAVDLMRLGQGSVIEKTRHKLRRGSHIWEIDVFGGANEGLILAEIELGSEDEAFERPDWLGAEVSADRRYYGASLAQAPFRTWEAGSD